MLRRLLAVLAMLAAPLTAGPSPAAGPAPVLVVYPPSFDAALPATTGSDFADKLAAQITQLGGITIVRGAPNAQPADYRTGARAAGADLYFSGAIVRVGNAYAVLEELVSARSGIVTWSATSQSQSLTDVTIDAQRIHDNLLGIVQARALAAAPPAYTPRTATAGTPAPGAAPAAARVAPGVLPSLRPGTGFAVLPVVGSANGKDRTLATSTIIGGIQHLGFGVVPVARSVPVKAFPGVCDSTKAKTLILATLETSRTAANSSTPGEVLAVVNLLAYDCASRAFDDSPITQRRLAVAGDDAIRGAVTDGLVLLPAIPPLPGL
jgi:hypothetical protein